MLYEGIEEYTINKGSASKNNNRADFTILLLLREFFDDGFDIIFDSVNRISI